MRRYKFIPLLSLFLLLSGGQSVLVIDQTEAGCCNIYNPACVSWSGLVYGSSEILGTVANPGMFRIKNDKGFFLDVKASQDVIDEFQKEFQNEKIKIDFGFSVLKRVKGELTLIAFVPADRDHHNPTTLDKTQEGAARVVNVYNTLFEQAAKPPSKPGA
ncbi:MAG TPA: hypothetical protein VKB81_05700 [Nitrospira sp.]|nr:hypothetical protein [Nitrospira sp.]